MPIFSAKGQAAQVMKQLQGTHIKSVRTVDNYERALKTVCQYIKTNKICHTLQDMTPEQAINYLDVRAEEVGQKTLDMERQAMQVMMHKVSKQLPEQEKLPVIKSEHEQILTTRAYTSEQVEVIADHQLPKHALATEVSYNAGLRAHELYTLKPISERLPDERPTLPTKFEEREGQRYTVIGKGGLVREVVIRADLVERLEKTRFDQPHRITDRTVHYQQYYDIGAGNNWSASFTRASNRALGWSNGAHGVRHAYAQERMDELQNYHSYETALETVSQEMGHFRPDITEVYLR